MPSNYLGKDAVRRILVQRTIYNDFAKRFAEIASKLKTGNPFKKNSGTCGTPAAVCWDEIVPDEEIYYGPIINQQGFDKIRYMNSLWLRTPNQKYYLTPLTQEQVNLTILHQWYIKESGQIVTQDF